MIAFNWMSYGHLSGRESAGYGYGSPYVQEHVKLWLMQQVIVVQEQRLNYINVFHQAIVNV
jgi:hypothetical protein